MTPMDLTILIFAVIGFATVAPILLVCLVLALFVLGLGFLSALSLIEEWFGK